MACCHAGQPPHAPIPAPDIADPEHQSNSSCSACLRASCRFGLPETESNAAWGSKRSRDDTACGSANMRREVSVIGALLNASCASGGAMLDSLCLAHPRVTTYAKSKDSPQKERRLRICEVLSGVKSDNLPQGTLNTPKRYELTGARGADESATIDDLHMQLQAKNQDIEELKADKRDLRSLVAKLNEELIAAKTEASKTALDLQLAKLAMHEYAKKINVLEGSAGSKAQDVEVVETAPSPSVSTKPTHLEGGTRSAVAEAESRAVRSPSIEIIDAPPQGKGKRKAVDTDGPSRKRTRASQAIATQARVEDGLVPPLVPEHVLTRPSVRIREDQAFVLPVDVLASYLKDVPPISITPAPSGMHILRQLLQSCYGTLLHQNVQYIDARRNPADKRCPRTLILMRADSHPSMPLTPGHSGIITAGRFNPTGKGPYSLFRKDLRPGLHTWLYLGEYEWSLVGKMSTTVFQRQSESPPSGFAQTHYFLAMRTRIALRKAERKGTQGGNSTVIYTDDVISSLSRGEEVIDLVLLRCVSYDWTFMRDIEANFRASQVPKRRARGRPRGSKNSSTLSIGCETPFVKAKNAASRVQPGVYTTGTRIAPTTKTRLLEPFTSSSWSMAVLDAKDSLNARPVRITRSTWDSSAGQKVKQECVASSSKRSPEVIDLVQEGVDDDDMDGEYDAESEVNGAADVMMSGAEGDGYISYASEDPVDDFSYGYP
ncbi:hypothetical protein NMY22_g14553 [Coprinellus aureogranulatus]|nr:hypothetical protein NMY22_g14553 [Coprinellus aureogranulatus]